MSTQFYKVTLRNAHLVSVFSGSGKKQTVTQESRELIQVIGGLPRATALAYQKAQPNCTVEIDDSFNAYDSKPAMRVREAGERGNKAMRIKKASSPAPVPAPAPAPAPAPVLGGGDYGSLVNKLAKKDAA